MEVQNQVDNFNLKFSIFQKLQAGKRPSKICEELGMKPSALQYHLSSLKRSGFIKKVGYGTWEILKEFNPKELQKSSRVATAQLEQLQIQSDMVRAHAFQFVLRLPSNLRNWAHREEILQKMGIITEPLSFGGLKRGQKINFKGRKIWLMDNSIVIYEKASYLAQTAKEGKDYAISDLMSLIRGLENFLQASFSFAGKYKFKVSRQHYSLIKNALAKQYDKEGKKLEIYTDKGLWFLIDNSFNLHEAETLHPQTAETDNKKVQDFFNGLKQTEDFTPQFVVNAIANVTKNQVVFDKNMSSHLKVLDRIGKAIDKLSGTIKKEKKRASNQTTLQNWKR